MSRVLVERGDKRLLAAKTIDGETAKDFAMRGRLARLVAAVVEGLRGAARTRAGSARTSEGLGSVHQHDGSCQFSAGVADPSPPQGAAGVSWCVRLYLQATSQLLRRSRSAQQ